MRNRNVFGKRITRTNIIFMVIIVFAIIFAARVFLLNQQNSRLSRLEADQRSIQMEINRILNRQEVEDIYSVDEIINHLPTSFNQDLAIINMSRLLNTSQLTNIDGFSFTFNENVTGSPIGQPLIPTIRSVGLTLRVRADNPLHFVEFIENVLAEELFYFIGNVAVSYYTDGSGQMTLTFYTFYNNVNI